jgi:hypothetical protein
MPAVPRIARVPLTAKQPDACPYCGGRNLTRDCPALAMRLMQARVHAWSCSAPQQDLSPAHDSLGAHRLQPRLHAGRDRRPPQEKTHRSVSPSTITSWLNEYNQHCSYRRLRSEGLKRHPPVQAIRSIKLYHRQVYGYAFHRPKLDFARSGMLDDKRAGDTRFAALADFLESIPTICPHDLFRRDDDPKARASQAEPARADASRIIINQKKNSATDTAALIIPAVGNNKLRHEMLQHFMLRNDSVTVAVEIPIWLDEDDIAALEAERRVEISKMARNHIFSGLRVFSSTVPDVSDV